MIQKRDKNTDISSEVAQGRNFRRRLMACAEEGANRFMKGDSLNQALADIAKRESFNRLQIQRLVEETNTIAFNKKYDQVRSVNDRRVTFDLATLADILALMGDQAPPEIENPNWTTGRPGIGEIEKEATEKTASVKYHEELREKVASQKTQQNEYELYEQARALNRSIESEIFKIANCLVMSEKIYKNANRLFNTVLDKVAFEPAITDGIVKKAEEIADYLKETNRIRPDFVVSLSVEPQEKIASTLFGKHSLLNKEANNLIETPNVQPVSDIRDIQDLFSIAKKIQESQKQMTQIETKLHGGA